MSEFQSSELRSWRKLHHLSQEKFATFSHIGLNTIMKIEAGGHKLQDLILVKLKQAVRDYEATVKKDELVTASSKNAKPVASMPAASEIEKEMPGEIPAKSNPPKPLVLSNLDLELINRVLMMTPIEKVGLLKSLIEYGYRTTQSRRTQTPHVAPSCAESRE